MNKEIIQQIHAFNYSLCQANAAYDIWAKKRNLNFNSLVIISTLEENELCTQKNLTEILMLPKSTVHSIMKDFINKEYIYLEAMPGNKKEKIIRTTEKGAAYFSEIITALHETEERVVGKLGTNAFKQLVELNAQFGDKMMEEVIHE